MLRNIELQVLSLHHTLNVRPTVETARKIGELLIEAKAVLAHGEYLPWLARVGLSARTAQVYVQVAKAGNTQGPAHLTIDRALALIRAGRRAERRERTAELVGRLAEPDRSDEIICGDALPWLRRQPDDSIPFVVTDPPYGTGATYDGWREPDGPDAYWTWFRPYWEEMARIIRPGGVVVMWQAYVHLPRLSAWYPGARLLSYCFFLRGIRQWEPVVVWTKPGGGWWRVMGSTIGWSGIRRLSVTTARTSPPTRARSR